MRAVVFEEAKKPITVSDIAAPVASADQVLVTLEAASLNHRDIWMTYGAYPGLRAGVTAGSCGAGVVDGRAVIINPNCNWGNNPAYPDHEHYSILGMPVDGTFAEQIAVSADRLADKPSHLTMAEAAALPLAGLTAYRALFGKARTARDDRVLISGVGGGVALFACQFAIAAGCEVFVTSGDDEKIEQAVTLGAKGGANYREEKWAKSFLKKHGGVDVVIDSAGGKGFDELTKIMNPLGRLAMYGGTRGHATFSPQALFWKELQFFGSTMGSDEEFAKMVSFVAEHKIVPVVDSRYTLDEAAAAYERMDKGQQFGKIILEIS